MKIGTKNRETVERDLGELVRLALNGTVEVKTYDDRWVGPMVDRLTYDPETTTVTIDRSVMPRGYCEFVTLSLSIDSGAGITQSELDAMAAEAESESE